jgi:acyl-CoA hydrolase
MTPEEAAALVGPEDTLAVPLGPGVPGQFVHALGKRDDFEDLLVFGALLPDLYEVFMKPGVRLQSGFFGPAERFLLDNGAPVEFVPADFRRFALILEELNPRIVATAAAEPDNDGYMSLSLHAGASVGGLHAAAADPDRVCLVETSPHFPSTVGLPPEHRHALHVDEVDIIVTGDASPFELADTEPGDADQEIAAIAARYIPDGATLQTGIGAIPNAVASLLAQGDGGGYGIHSEMFTTGLMHLCKAGKVTNLNKGEFDGFSVTTFAAGTAELYEWLDGNETVRFLPVDVVNAPQLIGKNSHMITINGAVSIDLLGQVVADSIDGKQFSGVGGHEDFIAGAGLELEDRSLVCLRSQTSSGVSRIVANHSIGSIVATPRHQLDVVITEYGAAELLGKTVRERARALCGIAHPDQRPTLRDAIETMG